MRLVRVGQTSTGTDIQSYLLRQRLHLFDAVVTLTIAYVARTWATTKNTKQCAALHSAECFDSSSRQMNIPKYLSKKKKLGEKYIRDDDIIEDTQEEDSTHDEYDHDSRISFDYVEDSNSKPRRRFRRLDT